MIYECAINEGVIAKGEIGLVKTVNLKSTCEDKRLDAVGDAPDVAALRSRMVKARDIGGRSIGGRRLKLRRGITMDSGASANVMPTRMVREPSQIRSSPGSRAGVRYVAANHGTIKNEGEYDANFQTTEGHEEMVTMQIAQVNKALGSVVILRSWKKRSANECNSPILLLRGWYAMPDS